MDAKRSAERCPVCSKPKQGPDWAEVITTIAIWAALLTALACGIKYLLT